MARRQFIDLAIQHFQTYDHDAIKNAISPFIDMPIGIQIIDDRIQDIIRDQQVLHHLISMPKLEQRSPEWYAMRKNMITASDLAQALGQGKFGTQKDLIIKKCGFKEEAPFQASLPPLKWGIKYEPLAIEMYKRRAKVDVHDFGLLPHPTIPFFGASPDGINELGVMVEIKCPFKRKINGEIPMQYYYQMQGQLDVCGLCDCDYLECEFVEYSNMDEFLADCSVEDPRYTHDFKEKGVFIEYRKAFDSTPYYVYGPHVVSADMYVQWVEATTTELHSQQKVDAVYPTFWRLQTYMCQRVVKDAAFIEEKYKELEIVWNKIQMYKADRDLYDREIEGVGIQQTKNISVKSKKQIGWYFQPDPTPVLDDAGSDIKEIITETPPPPGNAKKAKPPKVTMNISTSKFLNDGYAFKEVKE